MKHTSASSPSAAAVSASPPCLGRAFGSPSGFEAAPVRRTPKLPPGGLPKFCSPGVSAGAGSVATPLVGLWPRPLSLPPLWPREPRDPDARPRVFKERESPEFPGRPRCPRVVVSVLGEAGGASTTVVESVIAFIFWFRCNQAIAQTSCPGGWRMEATWWGDADQNDLQARGALTSYD